MYGNYAYATDEAGDLEIIDIRDPENPIKIKEFFFENGRGIIYDVAVSGKYAYVAVADVVLDIKEIEVKMNIYNDGALYVIDISYPENPIKIGSLNLTSSAFGVSASKDYIAVADISKGLYVFGNISTNAIAPIVTSTLSITPTPEIAQTPQTTKETPAFEAIFAIAMLLVMVYMWRKGKNKIT